MKKAKHTAGPWGFEDKDNRHMVTAGKDRRGAFIYICDPSYSSAKTERANARLIVAAPDLLAALKGFYDGECGCDVAVGRCVQCIAGDAIAKAEGRRLS